MSAENFDPKPKIPTDSDTEAGKVESAAELSPEEAEQAAYWLGITQAEEAKKAEAKKPEPTEIEREASEMEEMLRVWLAPERLAHLNGITTEAEAMADPMRAEAKLVLAKIIQGRVRGLEDRYIILSRAIGMINGVEVDHTR